MSGNLARSVYRKIVTIADQRKRSRLIIPVSSERTAGPTVYFLTPDHQRPAGGIRVIYRHVDILNSGGIKAFVLHQRRGFRCNWFEHNTEIADVSSAKIRRGDLLVVSELDVDLLLRIPAGVRHVIFNQSGHLTWQRVADQVTRLYSANPDLVGVVAVSKHSQEMLKYAFGGRPIERIHQSIDSALFHPGERPGAQRIAYMPRRAREDAQLVLQLLHARGVLNDWDVAALDGLSHAEVAVELRNSRIFLAFTYQEGFGLPAAEAMACGNYVIGYHGFGGREFFRPEFSAPMETGDVLGFARAVERVVNKEREEADWCWHRGRRASEFILSEYSRERERSEVIATYRGFLLPTA